MGTEISIIPLRRLGTLGFQTLLHIITSAGENATGRFVLQAELPESTCYHTFPATGITNYLGSGGTLESAQAIAAHASSRRFRANVIALDPTCVQESGSSSAVAGLSSQSSWSHRGDGLFTVPTLTFGHPTSWARKRFAPTRSISYKTRSSLPALSPLPYPLSVSSIR